MLGRFGDLGIGRVCTTSNPVNYLLPGVTTGTYVLYAIASVRIYHHNTQLSSNFNLNHIGALRFVNNNNNNGHQWVYSHLKGTLVFGYDKPCAGTEASPTVEPILALDRGKPEANGEWWFQLVDDETDKVAWKFKLPISPGSKFNYELDRPFFHVFQGSSRKYGFLFADDRESEVFSGEVTTRVKAAIAALSKSRSRSFSSKLRLRELSPSSAKVAGISGVTVSSPTPNSFKHIAHIGFDQTKGDIEASKNLDPTYRDALAGLQIRIGSDVTDKGTISKTSGKVRRNASKEPVLADR